MSLADIWKRDEKEIERDGERLKRHAEAAIRRMRKGTNKEKTV